LNPVSDEKETGRQPRGLLALRTVGMPKDTNPSGDIFGGWILSQMDIRLEVWAKPFPGVYVPKIHLVTEGIFRYFAVDDQGRPRKIPDNPESKF
jgi:acyl-CoA thioesterase YciA